MDEPIISIGSGDGAASCEVKVGHAHWAKYRIVVWNADGDTTEKVVEGTNVDGVSDLFKLASSAAKLSKRLLTIEMLIVSYQGAVGEPYNALVQVTQKGDSVPGGDIWFSGNLGEGGLAARAARLRFNVA